jgi:hypothetical protein
MPATAKSWTLLGDTGDTGETRFRVSSRQTAAFFMNHPTLAIVTLWVIAIIGFVCLL